MCINIYKYLHIYMYVCICIYVYVYVSAGLEVGGFASPNVNFFWGECESLTYK